MLSNIFIDLSIIMLTIALKLYSIRRNFGAAGIDYVDTFIQVGENL